MGGKGEAAVRRQLQQSAQQKIQRELQRVLAQQRRQAAQLVNGHGCHGGHGFMGSPLAPTMLTPQQQPLNYYINHPNVKIPHTLTYIVENPTSHQKYLVVLEPKKPTPVAKQPAETMPEIITGEKQIEVHRLKSELAQLQKLKEIKRLQNEIDQLKKELADKNDNPNMEGFITKKPISKEVGGKTRQQPVYPSDWKGYTTTRKSEALKKTLYYSPKDGIWYYRNSDGVYLPLGE